MLKNMSLWMHRPIAEWIIRADRLLKICSPFGRDNKLLSCSPFGRDNKVLSCSTTACYLMNEQIRVLK